MVKIIKDTSVECRREMRGVFLSLNGYLFLILFLILVSLLTFTYGKYFERGEASLAGPFFSWLPTLFCLFIPALTMKIWSDEIRSSTLELLLSSPVSLRSLVLGKFFAVVFICLIALILTSPIVLTTIYLGKPDIGSIVGGYLGTILLIGAYASISCLMSALFRSQTASYLIAAIICYMPIFISSKRIGKEVLTLFPDYRFLVDGVALLGINSYFLPFLEGLLELRGGVYFLVIMILALVLNWLVIKRIQISS